MRARVWCARDTASRSSAPTVRSRAYSRSRTWSEASACARIGRAQAPRRPKPCGLDLDGVAADTSGVEAEAASPFPVSGLTPPTKRTGLKRRIGDVIVQLGFAERELVERVVENGRRDGLPLGQALIEAGIVNPAQLAQALAERNGLDYVDLNSFDVDKGAAAMIDGEKARPYRTIPIAFLAEQTLLVATADPANLLALDDITMATGYEVRRAVASPEDIDATIGQLSHLGDAVEEFGEEEDEAEVIELRDQADEAPVVKLVHSVIADAVRRGASDIHFEPRSNDMRVRY